MTEPAQRDSAQGDDAQSDDAARRDEPGRTGQPRRGAANAWARARTEGRVYLALSGMFLLAIVVMLNYLSYRHYDRWDWTSAQVFTLSERTEQVLSELSRPVDVHLLLSRSEPQFRDLHELLERYRAETDLLRMHYVDPDRQRGEYQALLRRLGASEAVHSSGALTADVAAVVTAGESTWRITRDDVVEPDVDSFGGDGGSAKVALKAERALTGALLQVTQGEPARVCLTEGHGEWSLSGGERNLYALEEELRRNNVEVEGFQTLGAASVPEGCDAVFVLGPVRAFSEAEAKLLDRYLASGGRLLVAADPSVERERIEPIGLESMLREHGVRLDRSVVLELDPARLLAPSPLEPFVVTDFGAHATTRRQTELDGRFVMFEARSVRPLESAGEVSVLLRTSSQGYAETRVAHIRPDRDLGPDADDIAGPVTLGVAVELEGGDVGAGETAEGAADRRGRLVVIGDSDWLMPAFMQSPETSNLDLASAWTGWLTERKALISIPSRELDAAPMMMTEADLGYLLVRLGLMPLAVLLMGFAVWWSRRS